MLGLLVQSAGDLSETQLTQALQWLFGEMICSAQIDPVEAEVLLLECANAIRNERRRLDFKANANESRLSTSNDGSTQVNDTMCTTGIVVTAVLSL